MPTDLDRTLAWLEGFYRSEDYHGDLAAPTSLFDAFLAVARAGDELVCAEGLTAWNLALKALGCALERLAALGPATT